MGFLDSVQVQGKSGGFLKSAIVPSAERGAKIQSIQKSASSLQSAAYKASSPLGLYANTTRDFADRTSQAIGDAFVSTWKSYSDYPAKIKKDVTERKTGKGFVNFQKENAKAGFRVAGDTAIAIFAPISAAIGAALSLTGGQKIIDKTGEVIADKSGITDLKAFQKFAIEHPNAGEDFERLLTLAFAGLERGKIDPPTLVPRVQSFVRNVVNPPSAPVRIKINDTTGAEMVPVRTPSSRYADYLKEMGYEPYTAPGDLPVIDFGAKAQSSLPTIQIGEGARLPQSRGSLRYEPIKETPTTPESSSFVSRVSRPKQVQTATPDATAPKQTSGLAQNTVQDAIMSGIKAEFGSLPEYSTMNMAKQAQDALAFVESNPEGALRVINGKETPPGDLRVGSVFVALKTKAIQSGDVARILELTRSPINERAAALGQEIKAFDGVDSTGAIDPIKALTEVRQSRMKKAETSDGGKPEKTVKTEVEKVKAEIKKTAPTKETWADFISSIEC